MMVYGGDDGLICTLMDVGDGDVVFEFLGLELGDRGVMGVVVATVTHTTLISGRIEDDGDDDDCCDLMSLTCLMVSVVMLMGSDGW